MTEYFAKVSISCPTEDAELSVNGEQKGVGRWGGMVIPGKYTIEASKDGCHSQTRQIELKDNDEVTVDFTKLKTITGSLRVDYEPAGADVLLNGKKVGVTPLVLKELPVGDYNLEIWKEYYVKEFATVRIAEDQEWKEKGKLTMSQFARLIVYAEEGTEKSPGFTLEGDFYREPPIEALAQYYRYGAADGGRYGHYRCEKDTFHIPLNPVKSLYWYKKVPNWDLIAHLKRVLGASYPSIENDENLSYAWAKKEYEDMESSTDSINFKYKNYLPWAEIPYAPLAWHYFYGIGCQKDIEKAKQLIRLACTKDGFYDYPSYIEMIKEMRLEDELKYNPHIYD